MKKRARKTKAKAKGPLAALGWKRAFYNPATSKELRGAWALPPPEAVAHSGKVAMRANATRVFRDTATGKRSAAKAGLV